MTRLEAGLDVQWQYVLYSGWLQHAALVVCPRKDYECPFPPRHEEGPAGTPLLLHAPGGPAL
ncbi:hypothetical protein [Streptomyces sp. NPDC000410]|uniref:hypothetical protein n=1 Tax=Streptomyces sp. NPDC000410 TaxID=3154254 RepID=UPI003325421D